MGEVMAEELLFSGALVGWRQEKSDHGMVLRLQVARSLDDYRERGLDRIDLALNDRQLRSLTRDLVRMSDSRDLSLFAPNGMLQRLRRRLGRRV